MLLRPFLRMQNKMQDVRVKAGTLDGVKALAGYARDKNGNLISFAFIANNLLPETNESLFRIHEELIKLLMRHTTDPAEQTPLAVQVTPEEKPETDTPLVQTPAAQEPEQVQEEPAPQAPVLQEETPAPPAAATAATQQTRPAPKINPKKKRRKPRFPPGPRPKPGPIEEEPARAPVPEEPQAPAIILVGAEDLPDEQIQPAPAVQEPTASAELAAQAPEQVQDAPAQ